MLWVWNRTDLSYINISESFNDTSKCKITRKHLSLIYYYDVIFGAAAPATGDDKRNDP